MVSIQAFCRVRFFCSPKRSTNLVALGQGQSCQQRSWRSFLHIGQSGDEPVRKKNGQFGSLAGNDKVGGTRGASKGETRAVFLETHDFTHDEYEIEQGQVRIGEY